MNLTAQMVDNNLDKLGRNRTGNIVKVCLLYII